MMENFFTIRHYVPEKDLSPLSRLLTEIESMDRDGEDTSKEYLRASLAWPNYHPSEGVWVAELEGKLIGYAAALATFAKLHGLRGCPSIPATKGIRESIT